MLAFLWVKYNFFRFWSEIWPRNVLDRFVTFKPEQRSQRYNNIAWRATWNIQHNIQRDTVNTSRYKIQPDTRLHKYTTQYDSMHMKRAEDFHTLREQLRDEPWYQHDSCQIELLLLQYTGGIKSLHSYRSRAGDSDLWEEALLGLVCCWAGRSFCCLLQRSALRQNVFVNFWQFLNFQFLTIFNKMLIYMVL